MNYKNSEIKIIDLINHLKSGKINLSPIFQRGRVWKIKLRKKLLQNMVDLKPIPAIFLYKKESGETYTYNILDGKQRIESLILFIGNQRNNLKIDNWNDYFFSQADKKNINLMIYRKKKCGHLANM